MKLTRAFGCGLMAALSLLAMPAPAVAQAPAETTSKPEKSPGSLYLQCDGNPNNMSAGELVVRLVAITAIVGLLAPSPEQPDASKRKFGEAGVAACTGLVEGSKREGNAERRIPLILARALHRIEAKDYSGAIADVDFARRDAQESGLSGNPYFDRSVGVSLPRIEADARIRMGDVAGARAASLAGIESKAYSYVPLIAVMTFPNFGPPDDAELKLYELRSKFSNSLLWSEAMRLEELGRFQDAALVGEGSAKDERALRTTEKAQDSLAPRTLAMLAIVHALAEEWDTAQTDANAGREQLQILASDGKPVNNVTEVVELLDFYDVLKTLHGGDVVGARRTFGARSRWTAVPYAPLAEAHRRLSVDIPSDQRTGLLAQTTEELRKEWRENDLARLLETDKNNKALFGDILPYVKPTDFEDLSHRIWTTKGSGMLSKQPVKGTDQYTLIMLNVPGVVVRDAMMLHAALQAKAHGKQGFVYTSASDKFGEAFVRFVDPGDPNVFDQRYSNADEVIRALEPVFPSPDDLTARRRGRAPH